MTGTIIRDAPSAASTKEGEPRRFADAPGDIPSALTRHRLYGALALAFDRPGEDFTEALQTDRLATVLESDAATIGDAVDTQAAAVLDALTDTETIHGEWAALFGVEEGLSVPPYELRYLPGPLLTNIRQLSDIRGFFTAFGLSIRPGANDRADHLCFQLEFLAHLTLQEAILRDTGDETGVEIVVDARRRFLEDHLGRWYWRFAGDVNQRNDGFYATLANLLSALIEAELSLLDIEPEYVPDHPDVTDWNEDIFGDVGRGCGGCGAVGSSK